MTIEEINAAAAEVEQKYKNRLYHEVEKHAQSLLGEALLADDYDLQIKLQAWYVLSICYQDRKAEALTYAEQLLVKTLELAKPVFEARANATLGFVYKAIPDFKQALFYTLRSSEIYEDIGDKENYALQVLEAGGLFYGIGDNTNALISYSKALAVFDALDDKNQVGVITLNMGAVLDGIGDYNRALEYFEKCLSTYISMLKENDTSIILGNMGVVYHHMDETEKSIEFLEKSIVLSEKMGHKRQLADSLTNLGSVYEASHQPEKALTYLERALKLQRELGDPIGEAYVIGNMGSNYANEEFEQFDLNKAEEYLLKAIEMLSKLGTTKSLWEFERDLARVYKHQKKWEQCYMHFERFYETEKQVKSDEAKQQASLSHYSKQQAEIEREQQVKLAAFQEKERILHSVLPAQIAERIVGGEKQIADYFPAVSILFADIEGFTSMSADMPAHVVVQFLNHIFSRFDQIMKKHGCEKIKTIGDGYLAVAGAPTVCEDHAERLTHAAIEMLQSLSVPDEIKNYMSDDDGLAIRIGIHTGSVVAGVVGEDRFVYDVYSDAVNIAARMESHGEPGKIHVSSDFMKHLTNRFTQYKIKDHGINFVKRSEIEVKGKGKMKTFFLNKAV